MIGDLSKDDPIKLKTPNKARKANIVNHTNMNIQLYWNKHLYIVDLPQHANQGRATSWTLYSHSSRHFNLQHFETHGTYSNCRANSASILNFNELAVHFIAESS